MYCRKIALIASLLCVLCLPHLQGIGFAATVTVNENTVYQAIDGFGGYGGLTYRVPPYNDAWVRLIVDSLGITMLRLMMPTGYEGVNDNADPSVFDTTKILWNRGADGGTLTDMLSYIEAVSDYAKSKNQPLKLIVTSWSPEAWMKSNNSINGGTLNGNMYDEYAEWVVQFLKLVKSRCGTEIFGYCIQNEPELAMWYISCTMSASVYRDVSKVLGARIRQEGLNTKLYGSDCVGTTCITSGWAATLGGDSTCAGYYHAFSVHGYENNGTTGNPGSAQAWQAAGAAATRYGKHLWMTETAGYGGASATQWQQAWNAAQGFFNALGAGNANGWTWWQLASSQAKYDNGEALMVWENPGTITTISPRFYVHEHFCKYVWPGSVRVSAVSNDTANTKALAFVDQQRGLLTIQLLSFNGTQGLSVSVGGNSVPTQYRVYQTTSTLNCRDQGVMAANGTIDLPAQSITSLVGGFPVSVAPGRQARQGAPAYAVPAKQRRVYAIDGRLVSATRKMGADGSLRMSSKGVYIAVDAAAARKTSRVIAAGSAAQP